MSRAHALNAARIGFVLLTVVGAWWGFHDRWDEIGSALRRVRPVDVIVAVALTMAGLELTAMLWRRLLGGLGSALPWRPAASVFLLGQLGKYVPGSVWSFAAQAQLGRRYRVPARVSVAASAVFLLVHVATGTLLGSVAAAIGVLDTGLPRWVWALGAVVAVVALCPPFVRRAASLMAGQRSRYSLDDLVVVVALMSGVWLAYGGAALLMLGSHRTVGLQVVVAAFALSHVAGVLLVIAPAGLGAREAAFVALVGPFVGVAPAVAAALLIRVVHTLADFCIAGLAWVLGRPGHVIVPIRESQERSLRP